jgi:hypothetical protein
MPATHAHPKYRAHEDVDHHSRTSTRVRGVERLTDDVIHAMLAARGMGPSGSRLVD